jgi:Ricin-type beta-trefoil lectin domain
MRNIKRLFAAVTLTAGLFSLLAAPTAGAEESGAAAPSIAGLTLRPAHPTGKASPAVSAQAEDDLYLMGPVSDPGRCLDADTNTLNRNGTKVQLWDCDETAPNQSWYITTNNEGYFRFQNFASGRYIDADLNTINRNGTVIQLWDFVAGGTNQWFFGTPVTEEDILLQSATSGRCLDADANTAGRNGTVIQLWDCLGGDNQQW